MTATVAYTDSPSTGVPGSEDEVNEDAKENGRGRYTRVQIRVDSKVRNIEHGETKPTGQFNYTFTIDKDIRVMPQTYSEFMIWVDARRRAERVRASVDGAEAGENKDERINDGRELRMIE